MTILYWNVILYCFEITLENTEGAIKNEQSIETVVEHHYVQTNTNNVVRKEMLSWLIYDWQISEFVW
jgi:hypothetical protein